MHRYEIHMQGCWRNTKGFWLVSGNVVKRKGALQLVGTYGHEYTLSCNEGRTPTLLLSSCINGEIVVVGSVDIEDKANAADKDSVKVNINGVKAFTLHRDDTSRGDITLECNMDTDT